MKHNYTIYLFAFIFLFSIKSFSQDIDPLTYSMLQVANLNGNGTVNERYLSERKKTLMTISASIAEYVGVKMYVDLVDYQSYLDRNSINESLAVSKEGHNGYITIWIDAYASLGTPGLPANLGLVDVQLNNFVDDPRRRYAINALSGEVGFIGVSAINYDEFGEGNLDIETNPSTNISASLIGGEFNIVRFEMKAVDYISLMNSITSYGSSPAVLAFSLINNLIDKEENDWRIKLKTNLYETRPFSTLDNNEEVFISADLMEFAGGIDSDDDGIPNNLFISFPEVMGLGIDWSELGGAYGTFQLSVVNNGTQEKNFKIRISENPDNWKFYILDGDAIHAEIDNVYNVQNLGPGGLDNKLVTDWGIIPENETTKSFTDIKFELFRKNLLGIETIYDSLEVRLYKAPTDYNGNQDTVFEIESVTYDAENDKINIDWIEFAENDNAIVNLAIDPDLNDTPWESDNNHTWLAVGINNNLSESIQLDVSNIPYGEYKIWGLLYDAETELYSASTSSFTILNNELPIKPSIIYPTNQIETLEPEFLWSSFEAGPIEGELQKGFHLEVYNSSDEIVYNTGFVPNSTQEYHEYSNLSGYYDPVSKTTVVSQSLNYDSTYTWKVRYLDTGDDWSKWSDVGSFSIAPFSDVFGIEITSPNASSFALEQTMNIQWATQFPEEATYTVRLLKDGQEQSVLSTTATGNTYQWTIPANATLGTGYSIEIVYNDDENVSDESPLFEIIAPEPGYDLAVVDFQPDDSYFLPGSNIDFEYIIRNVGDEVVTNSNNVVVNYYLRNSDTGTVINSSSQSITQTINESQQITESGSLAAPSTSGFYDLEVVINFDLDNVLGNNSVIYKIYVGNSNPYTTYVRGSDDIDIIIGQSTSIEGYNVYVSAADVNNARVIVDSEPQIDILNNKIYFFGSSQFGLIYKGYFGNTASFRYYTPTSELSFEPVTFEAQAGKDTKISYSIVDDDPNQSINFFDVASEIVDQEEVINNWSLSSQVTSIQYNEGELTIGVPSNASRTVQTFWITVDGSRFIQQLVAEVIDPIPDFEPILSTNQITTGPGRTDQITIGAVALDGFNEPISASAYGLPAGVNINFQDSDNQFLPEETIILNVTVNIEFLAFDTYSFDINLASDTKSTTETVTLDIVDPSQNFISIIGVEYIDTDNIQNELQINFNAEFSLAPTAITTQWQYFDGTDWQDILENQVTGNEPFSQGANSIVWNIPSGLTIPDAKFRMKNKNGEDFFNQVSSFNGVDSDHNYSGITVENNIIYLLDGDGDYNGATRVQMYSLADNSYLGYKSITGLSNDQDNKFFSAYGYFYAIDVVSEQIKRYSEGSSSFNQNGSYSYIEDEDCLIDIEDELYIFYYEHALDIAKLIKLNSNLSKGEEFAVEYSNSVRANNAIFINGSIWVTDDNGGTWFEFDSNYQYVGSRSGPGSGLGFEFHDNVIYATNEGALIREFSGYDPNSFFSESSAFNISTTEAPVFIGQDQINVIEDQDLIVFQLSDLFSDGDTDFLNLSFEFTNISQGLNLVYEETSPSFTLKPNENVDSDQTFRISVFDGSNSLIKEFMVLIESVDDDTMAGIKIGETETIDEDESLAIAFNDLFTDIDNNTEDFNISITAVLNSDPQQPAGFDPIIYTEDEYVLIQPNENQNGLFDIQLQVENTVENKTENFAFTLDVTPINDRPEPFSLLNPLDEYVLPGDITFNWNAASDVEGDPVSYDFIISGDNLDDSYSVTSNETSYTIGEEFIDTSILWQVVATDGTDDTYPTNNYGVIHIVADETGLYPFDLVIKSDLSFDLDENTSPGTVFTNVLNYFPPDLNLLDFVITPSDVFSINSQGYLSLAAPLDFDVQQQHTLELTITYDNNPEISFVTDVIINTIASALPTAECKPFTAVLDENGTVTIAAADVDNGSTAPAGLQSLSVFPNTFGCTDFGDNQVQLTITDTNGDSSSCTAMVTVVDQTGPVLTCGAAVVRTSLSGQPLVIEVTPPTVLDNCDTNPQLPVATRSDNKPLTDPFEVGTTTILWTSMDAQNNQGNCQQTVTVNFTASTASSIASFGIPDQVSTTITGTNIQVVMPTSTDLNDNLSPVIEVSEFASVSPASGIGVDFSGGPVDYTVTAQDGVSKTAYAVTVELESDITALTSVPDDNFEAHLETHDASGNVVNLGDPASMGDGVSGNDYVFTERIAGVTNLDVSNLGITDLTGIEDFTALSTLRCNNNSISTLDISNNVGLVALYAFSNTLNSLTLGTNTNLKNIFLGINNLSEVVLSSIPNLEVFHCNNNALATLDLSNNLALRDLYLYDNNISELDVSVNTNLIYVGVRYNNLQVLDLSQNTNLESVRGSFNQLTSLNVKNGNNTLITDFMSQGNANLTCIEVDDATWSTVNWTNIDAQAGFNEDCLIQAVTLIPDPDFEQALIDLIIDSDGIINGQVFSSDIKDIPSLDVNGRDISDLTGIEGFNSLSYLNCNDNQLLDLDVSSNTLLKTLLANINQIASIDISQNVFLENFQIFSNNLTTLDPSNNPLLETLVFHNNQVTNIDVSQNAALTDLICGNNQLTSIDLSTNVNLSALRCESNLLTSLDVSQNPALSYFLYCYDNKLTSLNVKNGNNTALTNANFNATNNLNLTCIEVDDTAWSTTNWTNIDSQTSFSENCTPTNYFTTEFLNLDDNQVPDSWTFETTRSADISNGRINAYTNDGIGRLFKEAAVSEETTEIVLEMDAAINYSYWGLIYNFQVFSGDSYLSFNTGEEDYDHPANTLGNIISYYDGANGSLVQETLSPSIVGTYHLKLIMNDSGYRFIGMDPNGGESFNLFLADTGYFDFKSVDKIRYNVNAHTDNNGWIDNLQITVNVGDDVAPTAVCQDITLPLDGNGEASLTGAELDGGSSDSSGIQSLTVTPNSFDCENLGENQVQLTVTDTYGNNSFCMATVTVVDTTVPVLSCGDGIVRTSLSGQPLVIEVLPPTILDNCDTNPSQPVATRSDNKPLTDPFEVGTTTIIWTSMDAQNNQGSCQQTVTVNFTASSGSSIASFSIFDQVSTTITGTNIQVVMPTGTDLNGNLSPVIEVSEFALVSPASGEGVDFSGGPVDYTVTAQDGVSRTVYAVSVELESDSDGDGVANSIDQCPGTLVGESVDENGCTICDYDSDFCTDDDGDGVPVAFDLCPNTPIGETVDLEGCSDSQKDTDGDGVADDLDQCPGTTIGDSVDENGCSQEQNFVDDDGDGIANDKDLCPGTPNGEPVDSDGCSQSQLDDDNDGVANNLDQCPGTAIGDSVDENGCSQAQNFVDDDGDGISNANDLCPGTPNGESVDQNGCSASQNFVDDDNDGVANDLDQCPGTTIGDSVDENGCSQEQNFVDDDGDGIANDNDLCPSTPIGEPVDSDGCSQSQFDDDNDGVVNSLDQCPGTTIGDSVDENGCSQEQNFVDDDGDGISNDNDLCPGTPNGEPVDSDGCSQSQLDDDGDGVANSLDQCPGTTIGDSVDENGCSQAQNFVDDDSDLISNDNDLCPGTPIGELVDSDGCSQSQLDEDNDGVSNDIDICNNTLPNQIVDSYGCEVFQFNAFTIYTESNPCPGSSNGLIKISTSQETSGYVFDIELKGPEMDQTISNSLSYQNSISIEGLSPGSYDVIIRLENGYLNAFNNVIILDSDDLLVDKGNVNLSNKTAKYIVSGNNLYSVKVNDTYYTYSSDTVGALEIEIPIHDGQNDITITGKDCQSIYEDKLSLDLFKFYPNPAEDILSFNTTISGNIYIIDFAGSIVLNMDLKSEKINSIDISELQTGIYYLSFKKPSTKEFTFIKFVKR